MRLQQRKMLTIKIYRSFRTGNSDKNWGLEMAETRNYIRDNLEEHFLSGKTYEKVTEEE